MNKETNIYVPEYVGQVVKYLSWIRSASGFLVMLLCMGLTGGVCVGGGRRAWVDVDVQPSVCEQNFIFRGSLPSDRGKKLILFWH